MNLLDRYLYRTVILYAFMAMLVLLTLGALFLFISEQSGIGVGNYSAADAFLYTLLNVPQQAAELLPIGAMIGALMGLGNLAAGSELIITRASGVSVWRIAWPVGLAGVTMTIAMYGLSEYAAPPLSAFARHERTIDKLADVSFAGSSSAWVKDGNVILRVRTGEVSQAFGGVSVFELAGPTRLKSVEHAARISVGEPGRWRLHDVAESTFGADRVDAHRNAETSMSTTVSSQFLGLAATEPQMLTLEGLKSYIQHLRRNSLETSIYEISYYSRIARLFAVIVVTLLALPFVFGPLRSTGAGTRTVVGVLLGVVFFLITRTIENGGQLFNVDPIIVGWLPTCLVGLATLVAVSRTR